MFSRRRKDILRGPDGLFFAGRCGSVMGKASWR
jgi:hypothetical protein